MRRRRFERAREAQAFILRQPGTAANTLERWQAARQGTGFIEHHMGNPAQGFQRRGSLHQQAGALQAAQGRADRGGRGQRQCAGTTDDEHGQRDIEPLRRAGLPPVEANGGDDQQHYTDEPRRDAIGQPRQRGLVRLRTFDAALDVGHHGIGTDRCHFHL